MSEHPNSATRFRVPKAEGLLLKGLAKLQRSGCGEVLTELIRKEAKRLGVTLDEATKAVKKTPDEIATVTREARIRLGLTQTEWGRLFGLTCAQVALFESGARGLPKRAINAVRDWINQLPPLREDHHE